MSRKSPLKLNKSQVKIETIKKKYYPVYIILTVVSLTAGALNFFYSYSAVKAVVNRNEPEFKKNIIIIIFLFVIFVVGTVISLFGIVCVKASESKFAYRGLNLFSLSHFTANVKSLAVITIAVSVILSASFSLFTLGSVYAGVSEQKVINNYPFDIMLYVDSDRIKSEKEEGKEYYFNETIQSIKNQFEIKDFCGYEIYTAVTGENTKHIFESSGYEEVTWSNSSSDVFIKLSDYNEIRKVLGDKQLALSNNECAIHSQNYAGYIRGKDIDKLNINGKFYQLKTVNSGAFAQDCTETRINGEYGLIIVVPDSVCDSLKSYRKIVLINTERKISAEPQKYFENCDYKSSYGLYLESLLNGGEKRIEYRISDDGELEMQSAYNLADVFVQSEMLEIKRSVYLDFMLSFFYLAFIFSIITAVILMLYKISKINIEKYEYSVLDRLGVEKRLQKRAVLKEVLLLFGLPVAFALLSDVMLFTAIWRNSLFMSVTRGMLFEMFVFSQLFVIVLYFLFLAVTYFFEKENVVSDV